MIMWSFIVTVLQGDSMSSVALFVSWSLKGCFSCALSVRLFCHHCVAACCGNMTQCSSHEEECVVTFLWTMLDHFLEQVQLVAVHTPFKACEK